MSTRTRNETVQAASIYKRNILGNFKQQSRAKHLQTALTCPNRDILKRNYNHITMLPQRDQISPVSEKRIKNNSPANLL